MHANSRRDTKPEIAVRRLLHASGLRYRVDWPIGLPSARPIRPDVVFPKRKAAVFIDGCFWRGRRPIHGTRPATNRAYWDPKLDANIARDRRQISALELEGWLVLRFWEHEVAAVIVEQVSSAVRNR